MHMRHLALAAFVLAFAGCATTVRKAEMVKQVTQTEQGVIEGKTVDVIRRTEEVETEKSESQTKADVEPIIKATVAAMTGNITGALQQAVATISTPKESGLDGTVGALGSLAAGAGAMWLREFLARRAETKAKQQEINEEYERANKNHERAEQYARQLPPEVSKS